ncbi:hypothetical protein DPEC_G00013860 [Dallia pectoralis]|uniref:Uncharacterized protein n=1 Tax=Dallia pectoralis TaxID=75939 RepID=A0ACC2HMX4_DALPE|nr:hypothetical protein DPEC_G00013860 [Dallia pectoralis]
MGSSGQKTPLKVLIPTYLTGVGKENELAEKNKGPEANGTSCLVRDTSEIEHLVVRSNNSHPGCLDPVRLKATTECVKLV